MAKTIKDYTVICGEWSSEIEKPGVVSLSYKVFDDVEIDSKWKSLEYDATLETALLAVFAAIKTAAETAEGIS